METTIINHTPQEKILHGMVIEIISESDQYKEYWSIKNLKSYRASRKNLLSIIFKIPSITKITIKNKHIFIIQKQIDNINDIRKNQQMLQEIINIKKYGSVEIEEQKHNITESSYIYRLVTN